METIEIARLCAQYAEDKKAEDIILLDLRGLSPVTDFFVICTATSNPQMRAVRDEIVEQMRDQHDQKPLFHEGAYESQWLIVNYPNVMVHILSPEKREYYSLEELWGDAPRLPLGTEEPAPKKRAAKTTAKKATVKRAAAKKAAPAKKAAKKAARKKA
ncbi:MAG TPA: ribosome silencing factor [Prosthecobacter sp.]|nr:ribosome silencing factor [Prosthecobacter sp.]